MTYKAYATRTKTTGQEVLVAESSTPFTPLRLARLKEGLAMRSLEFEENPSLRLDPPAELNNPGAKL